jgi:cell division protein ZapE
MPVTLRSAYKALIQKGEIAPDPGQEAGIEALARLESELNGLGEPSLLSRFRHHDQPRGVYLWGPVGRGKSMLMDLFFETAPVERKYRRHFYAFMAKVHELIGLWRSGDAATRKAHFGQFKGDDPIHPVAELIADSARLLCFDELQVADIADAMILGRLFEALFARGVVLVATSNRPPGELYQGGINRELFLPFIEMIEQRLQVVRISGDHDHRLERLKGAKVYFSPITPEMQAQFDALWTHQIGSEKEAAATLDVLGHQTLFPRAAGTCLRATFASLCSQALGPQDYLAIAARFRTLFLEAVPRLGPDMRNEAVRFRALIDALYEARARLVVLADGEPSELYPTGDGAFEFERTASRLEEMRSAAWLEQPTH